MLEIAFHLEAEAEMVAAAATYEGEYRRHLLRRFPYGLIYRVASQKIFIVAVAHLRRKPGYWRIRQ